LSRLPDKYRAAVVLCALEGKSLKKAARQLGCPPGTVASRLARGRGLLAERLAGRGLALSGAALAAALAEGAAGAAVPTTLVASTVRAATAVAADPAAATAVVSHKVIALADEVVRSMLATKLKTATAVLLAVGMLGAGLLARADLHGDRPAVPSPVAAPEPARSDRDRLQGVWVAVSGAVGGRGLSPDQLRDWEKLIFAGDRVTRAAARWKKEGAFRVAEGHALKQLDLFTGHEPLARLYELDGTTLRLACRWGGPRPIAFDADGAVLVTFVRHDEAGDGNPPAAADDGPRPPGRRGAPDTPPLRPWSGPRAAGRGRPPRPGRAAGSQRPGTACRSVPGTASPMTSARPRRSAPSTSPGR
jgi:uncharacterized protein (TIGR03067 family)